MSKMSIQELVKASDEHGERAHRFIEAGNFAGAQDEMKALADKYKAFSEQSTEESPEQQEDDAQDKDSTDEKGCVGDAPPGAHCVKP